MNIYMLDNDYEYMAYWFSDDNVGDRLMGNATGQVNLPTANDLPLRMAPSFGDAEVQPTKLGDMHRFSGSRRLFSERAVEVLGLDRSGHLFEVELDGREEKFYWYWSRTIIDCLDEANTKRMLSTIQVPAFFEERVGDEEIFTTPDDQKFQFNLYVTDSFRNKVKKAKLKGFMLKKSFFDSKPWRS
jgi:hypothetical protein